MATESLASRWRFNVFAWVKYLTYAALAVNVGLFLVQELEAAGHSALDSVEPLAIIQLFSATLDTAAWVILLLLFELETAVIPDERLIGTTRITIHGIRLLAGLAIVSAFIGYVGEWRVFWVASSTPLPPCDLINQGWSVLQGLDDFVPLSAETCRILGTDALVITELEQVLADPKAFSAARDLALVDVINAGAWILVVIILEVEVRLQLYAVSLGRGQWLFSGFKSLLYVTLAAAAIYWGFEGDFLDFWDAALWLFAFVFIELNVFEWQRERLAAAG